MLRMIFTRLNLLNLKSATGCLDEERKALNSGRLLLLTKRTRYLSYFTSESPYYKTVKELHQSFRNFVSALIES